jgi:hypothetical protein
MRKLTILLAFSLGSVFAESPRLSIDSQTASRGETIVILRNESYVPATAYTVGTSDRNFAAIDTLLGGHDGRPLLHGDVMEIRIPGGTGEARIMAAVFEDGARVGDGLSVRRLLENRQSVLNDIPRAMMLLRHAIDQKTARPAAAFWFRQWNDHFRASHNGESNPVPLAAEMLLRNREDQWADSPARELMRVFEDLSAKLRESKPELY